tara:strand:+ start:1710 stop:2057 length:348 start_codon:yes stop_codon:yes gene_type:complete
METGEFWTLERGFWLGGEEHYRKRLNSRALMIFPPPVGILSGDDTIIATLQAAPRWASVDFFDQALEAHDCATTLAYRATGRRDGGAEYHALCSSTYVDTGDGWKLALHQQTPVG